jgi:hypothetical protein
MTSGNPRPSGPWVWPLVVLITLGSAYYQKVTGPTYPIRVKEDWQGQTIRARLDRSHGGAGDQRVEVRGTGEGVGGEISWRRYPSREPFSKQEMVREGDRLTGALPHQPPAGKLEYRITLNGKNGALSLPHDGTAITRFKGNVHLSVLIPHIILMFIAMLFSNRAGIGAASSDRKFPTYTKWVLGLLTAGGLILGPIVQKQAFGAFWTGVPFGWDLTDNKTLISVLGWFAAFWAQRINRGARPVTIAAALITLAVFLIPHSLFGSELKVE